jgi:STE24 endopeptidase
VNLSKSSRYHRAKRRADGAAILAGGTLLSALLLTRASTGLRTAVDGSPAAYAAVLCGVCGAVLFPLAWYRGCRLERQYELSDVRFHRWLARRLKAGALMLALATPVAELVYRLMRWPSVWWLIAAVGCAAALALATAAGPVLLLPLLHGSRPLDREVLRHRLERLSRRAGVPVLSVHEVPLGERTRRASAALVGAGTTRRILLSDTLLAGYSDDEIEVVMAHEIGHHVHRHMLKASAVELILLLAGFRLAAAALDAYWRWLGLASPADPAGMPLVVLAVGGVLVAATPLVNACSRSHERSADQFALETASEPAAFIQAVRRMAAQNLAEDRPSSAAFLFFHTHPTAEERIAAARDVLAGQRREEKAGMNGSGMNGSGMNGSRMNGSRMNGSRSEIPGGPPEAD